MKTSNCEKEIREKKRKEVDCMWISKWQSILAL
jgi:hypothetical protein